MKFYKAPKELLAIEGLSSSARLAYMVLADRIELSKSNGNKWINKAGEVFIKFKRCDLMEILQVKSRTTIAKIMKSLRDAGLIIERRLGQGKTNEITLAKPMNIKKSTCETPRCTSSVPYSKTKGTKTDSKNNTKENVVVSSEIKLPQNLIDKLSRLHGADVVATQIENLVTALKTQRIKNRCAWLTVACKEQFQVSAPEHTTTAKAFAYVVDEKPVAPVDINSEFMATIGQALLAKFAIN